MGNFTVSLIKHTVCNMYIISLGRYILKVIERETVCLVQFSHFASV